MNIPTPMLAPVEPINLEKELVDGELYAIQPKYDGIRLKFHKGIPYTRSGKRIPNSQIEESLIATYNRSAVKDLDLDGEIVLFNPDTDWFYPFNVVQSVMMSETQADITKLQDWQYIVFDHDDRNMCQSFDKRFKQLYDLFCPRHLNSGFENRIHLSGTKFSNDKAKVIAEAQFITRFGFEGAIIRKCSRIHWYKYGRVTCSEGHVRKYVEWLRDEATIIGFEPLMRNLDTSCRMKENMVPVNMLGNLLVEHSKFGKFSIGSGFVEEQRYNMWLVRSTLLGKRVTFKYRPGHIKKAPCPAIFVGIRGPEDMLPEKRGEE
jgi:hypothetical protein